MKHHVIGRQFPVLVAMAAGLAGVAPPAHAAVIVVSTDITVSTTWTANNTYNLASQIYVLPGATLTIEAGTVIASTPTLNGGGSLAVTRGAKIIAVGKKDNPIIFTSTADVATWAPDPLHPTGGNPKTGVWREACSEWGNVTLMGDAFISENGIAGNVPTCDPDNIAKMEGLLEAFPGDPRVLYGGGDDDDDSGCIRYVSLRYGGRVIGVADELNGMSIGGVGRETDISHVEIMNNVDDGIEIWGGTVSIKYFSIWDIGDDSVDLDQGWRGKLQFGLIVQGYSCNAVQGSGVGDNCFEMDGAEMADWQPVTTSTVYNCTVIGQPTDGDEGTAWRDNARVQFRNCIFMDLGEDLVSEEAELGGYGFGGTLSWAATWATDWNLVPPHANDCPPGTYEVQSSGKLAEIKDSVFFRNLFASAYTAATAVGVLPANAINNNVLIPGSDPATGPIKSIVRGPPVIKGGKTMLPVLTLDPRPANAALSSVAAAAADGVCEPALYRGAFGPGEFWLKDWTASHAYGRSPTPTQWTNTGGPLAGLLGNPLLSGTGPLMGNTNTSIDLTNARPSSLAAMFISIASFPVPFKGGILQTIPILAQLTVVTSPAGAFSLPFTWPAGIPDGFMFWTQYAIADAAAVQGVALSNGLKGTTQGTNLPGPPTISSIAPLSGPAGTVITINGTNFPLNPDDICCVLSTGVTIDITSSTGTVLTGTLKDVATSALGAGTLMLATGDGGALDACDLAPDAVNGVGVDQKGWGFGPGEVQPQFVAVAAQGFTVLGPATATGGWALGPPGTYCVELGPPWLPTTKVDTDFHFDLLGKHYDLAWSSLTLAFGSVRSNAIAFGGFVVGAFTAKGAPGLFVTVTNLPNGNALVCIASTAGPLVGGGGAVKFHP